MGTKTIKVDEENHEKVVEHTQGNGGKIGKFYEIAAAEKIDREKKPKKFKPNYETKA